MRVRAWSITLLLGSLCGAASAQVVPNPNNGSALGTSLTVSTLSTGTVLDVNAAVSPDSRYVTLTPHVSQSSLDGIDTFSSQGTLLPPLSTTALPSAFPAASLAVPPATPQAALSPVSQLANLTFVEFDKSLLAAALPPLQAQDVSLRDTIKKLSALTKTNIVLGTTALRQAKLNDQAPLTLDLPAQPLKQTLADLLTVVASTTPMVITAEDKVVFITTQAQADTQIVTRTYFLTDLLGNASRWLPGGIDLGKIKERPAPSARAVTPTPPPAKPRGLFDDDPPPPVAAATPPAPAPSVSIADVITSTIRPEIWKVHGGKSGEIRQYGDRVAITAPLTVHALLEGPSHRPDPNQAHLYFMYNSGGR